MRKRRSEDDRANEIVKYVNLDELGWIDDVYLRGIESLYTWKILVPERLRSGSYSDTLPDTLGDTLPDTLADTRGDTYKGVTWAGCSPTLLALAWL